MLVKALRWTLKGAHPCHVLQIHATTVTAVEWHGNLFGGGGISPHYKKTVGHGFVTKQPR